MARNFNNSRKLKIKIRIRVQQRAGKPHFPKKKQETQTQRHFLKAKVAVARTWANNGARGRTKTEPPILTNKSAAEGGASAQEIGNIPKKIFPQNSDASLIAAEGDRKSGTDAQPAEKKKDSVPRRKKEKAQKGHGGVTFKAS